jgi:Protein of unknown function (DUF2637)
MITVDRVIRWSTALAVFGVAAVAAVASYEHAYDMVRAHGESGWTARMVPLTVDGLIYASSMVMLDSARRATPVPALARWLLGLGIAATLAANVAHGLGHGLAGAAVAAWPAVALVGSYELLMMVIRGSQVPPDAVPGAGAGRGADPLRERAAELFAGSRCVLMAAAISLTARDDGSLSSSTLPRAGFFWDLGVVIGTNAGRVGNAVGKP